MTCTQQREDCSWATRLEARKSWRKTFFADRRSTRFKISVSSRGAAGAGGLRAERTTRRGFRGPSPFRVDQERGTGQASLRDPSAVDVARRGSIPQTCRRRTKRWARRSWPKSKSRFVRDPKFVLLSQPAHALCAKVMRRPRILAGG